MPYHENQTMRRWWVIVLCAVPLSLQLFLSIYIHKTNPAISIILALFLIPYLAIAFARLNLDINDSGIECSIFIFFKIYKKTIYWNDIQSIKIRPLNKMAEFGGLGIRYNPSTKIMGFIFQGKNAIEITKINGKKIDISIMNSDAVSSIIPKYFAIK